MNLVNNNAVDVCVTVDELLSKAGVACDGQINEEGFAKIVTFLTG